MASPDTTTLKAPRVFYGWWIVLAAFLNLFFSVGIIFYGFPVFYPSLVESLGFTRGQLTQGFLYGFLLAGPLFGLLAGALIDRLGPRRVIRLGIGFVGLSLVLMGVMSRLWQYYLLCFTEVVGYVLTGPIPNQVLISNWFRVKRGRAMGYAYLGLGLGGAVSPLLIHGLIERFGWRRALEAIGVLILLVLFPVAQWVTRSWPRELGLHPDGDSAGSGEADKPGFDAALVRRAVRTANFWLIVGAGTLTIGAIGTVIQHFVLFQIDQGYSTDSAAGRMTALLVASLAGRVVVGYFADWYRKKNVMALFYLVVGLSIPLLFLAHRAAALWTFAVVFGFAMGADYMLIPLVTAECFGVASLGKLLALIIMGYSVGQWLGPVVAGRIFDAYHSYDVAWTIMTIAGLGGAATIYAISPGKVQKGAR
jgi:MFS transporter, OFA family, oxalate/formate antiporter